MHCGKDNISGGGLRCILGPESGFACMQVYRIIRSSGISWEEATLRRKAMPLLMDWDATRPHTQVHSSVTTCCCCLTRRAVITHDRPDPCLPLPWLLPTSVRADSGVCTGLFGRSWPRQAPK